MTYRVLGFLLFLFVAIMSIVYGLKLPIDGLLLFLGILLPTIVGLFAHYRYVGRLRTAGRIEQALRHLRFWWIFLPGEAYRHTRIQILIESENETAARKAIEQAEKGGMADAFSGGFRADLLRRLGHPREAEQHLQRALDTTPPGLLRAGLLTQLSRLYIHDLDNKSNLKQVGFLLDEAERLSGTPPHKELIQAVRGEWFLKRKQPKKAIELLKKSLDILMHTAPPETFPTFFQRIGSLIIHLTYSQQDEHQYPFFAELFLSLGKAYTQARQPQKAREAFLKGLALCQQPFVALPLQEELQRIPNQT